MEIVTVQDTFVLAKELATPIEADTSAADEDIIAAGREMNGALRAFGDHNLRSVFGFKRAFTLPEDEVEAFFMQPGDFLDLELSGPFTAVARPAQFAWVDTGSPEILRGFGLRLHGVDVFEPNRFTLPAAFVPLNGLIGYIPGEETYLAAEEYKV